MYNNSEVHTRQRMRPWLESRIKSGEIPGLQWVDREHKSFRVPWKNVGNREWRENDSQIFKEWAVHTGRFREGIDKPDWPTWKTRFRCALTKLPDIQELKDQTNLTDQSQGPYRVYRFLPRTGDKQLRKTVEPSISVKSEYVVQQPTIPTNTASVVCQPAMDLFTESTVPRYPANDEGYDMPDGILPLDIIPLTVSTMNSIGSGFSGCSLASDLEEIASDDLVRPDESCSNMEVDIQDINSPNGSDIEVCPDAMQIAQKRYPLGERGHTTQQIHTFMEETDENEETFQLYVSLRYREKMLWEQLYTNPAGLRLFHSAPELQIITPMIAWNERMFGPPDVDQVHLPYISSGNESQDGLTMTLLKAMDRGVMLYMENGNIFAIRKCRCSVFVSSMSVNNGETMKLSRETPTMVYDYREYFRSACNQYIHGKGPKPATDVVLSFGQRFDLKKEPVTNLLISATIHHAPANCLISKISCSSPLSMSLEISQEDTSDRELKEEIKRFIH